MRKFRAALLCTPLLFGARVLVALTPDLGLVVRQQPNMLKANPVPLTYEGTIDVEGEKARYSSTWGGMASGYVVKFEKIPPGFTTGGVNEIWLVRSSSQCALLINRAPHPCMKLRFWGDFELGGSAERVVQNLSGLGIASSSDMVLRSINSKDFVPGSAPHESKLKPATKSLQGVFTAVLDYAGTNGTEIAFDTTTYAPLFARLPVESMTWELSGSPVFKLEKEENRNNLVINSRIEVREGTKLIGFDKRDEFRRITKPDIPTVSSRGSAAEIPFDRFTDKGRNFLKILFLTH